MVDISIIDRNSIPVPECGCWWWLGAVNHKGYGIAKADRRTMRAHRLSYILHHGPIPDGLIVLHQCDTPCCVNPDHLRLGTHQDNMDDASIRSRRPSKRGVSVIRKLTLAQRDEALRSTDTDIILGRRFGVAAGTIHYHRKMARTQRAS